MVEKRSCVTSVPVPTTAAFRLYFPRSSTNRQKTETSVLPGLAPSILEIHNGGDHHDDKTHTMSRTATRRLLALSPLSGRAETAAPVAARSAFQCLRTQQFSRTSRQRANEDEEKQSSAAPSAPSPTLDAKSLFDSASSDKRPSGPGGDSLSRLSSLFEEGQVQSKPSRKPFPDTHAYNLLGSLNNQAAERYEEPHHFHVFSSKHNCHITLTKPNRDVIMAMSCGNIGFKKSQRKHYDSSFQLASYVLGRIKDQGLIPQIKKLEVTLRGFGEGREAVTKALLGTEGRFIRGKIVKVSDATRLKFGGTRSPRPRRLG